MKRGAMIDWEVATELETERLIGLGEPPWVAAEQAVKNIRHRRQRNAAEEATRRFRQRIAEDEQCRQGYADYQSGRARTVEVFMTELERESAGD
jgi:hypothetical protein